MGTAELRSAFEAACEGKANCTAARLKYENYGGYEYQVLEFDGTIQPDDKPYSVRSDRIRQQGDLMEAAVETARNLIQQQGPKP